MNQETVNIVWLKRDLRLQDHEPLHKAEQASIDYPLPIVDLKESAKKARDKIWGHKKHTPVNAQKQRILATHANKRI